MARHLHSREYVRVASRGKTRVASCRQYLDALFRIAAADRIVGGIAGYILLGVLWNSQAQWARLLNEDAFFNVNRDAPTSDSEQLYYSFVTLTGLGYGDVVPTTSVAHLIAMLNVLSGVLYLAIFISALMGGLVEKKKK